MEDQLSEVQPPPLLLSVMTAAAALSVHPNTVRGLIADGEIPSVRLKNRRLIRHSDLCAYVAALPTDAPGGDA